MWAEYVIVWIQEYKAKQLEHLWRTGRSDTGYPRKRGKL
jgi:hypothetical protein